MTDYIKYRDAINDPKVVMHFGSSIFGRLTINPYNGDIVDLWKDRERALSLEDHKTNPNVLRFVEFMEEYEKTRKPIEYFLEVPLANPDKQLFYNLYNFKFSGEDPNTKRSWFRCDVYFPEFGTVIELDSGTYHGKERVPIDETKENIIYHAYGIPTVLRLNLTSDRKWEIDRAKKALFKYLDSAKTTDPIIHFPGIVESWNIHNRELLEFFPYVESVVGEYYCGREKLYSPREVILNVNSLPPVLGIRIGLDSISKPLKEIYKRIKNIDLRII